MCICDNPGIGRCYPLSTELKGDKVPAVASPRRATKGLKFIQPNLWLQTLLSISSRHSQLVIGLSGVMKHFVPRAPRLQTLAEREEQWLLRSLRFL